MFAIDFAHPMRKILKIKDQNNLFCIKHFVFASGSVVFLDEAKKGYFRPKSLLPVTPVGQGHRKGVYNEGAHHSSHDGPCGRARTRVEARSETTEAPTTPAN